MDSTAVRTTLALTLLGDLPMPLTVHLEYRVEDPYAVHARFDVGTDTQVRWVFARDLLDEGIVHPVGDGDVHVSPRIDSWAGHTVQIELSSGDGIAVLEASSQDVLAFLEQCYQLVPPGFESAYLDVDAALERLLGS
jgi:hypothetical protein